MGADSSPTKTLSFIVHFLVAFHLSFNLDIKGSVVNPLLHRLHHHCLPVNPAYVGWTCPLHGLCSNLPHLRLHRVSHLTGKTLQPLNHRGRKKEEPIHE